MKYLALCYYDTAAFEKLPASEAEKIGPACKPHDANLKATGKLVIQGSLADPGKWFHFVPKDLRSRRPRASPPDRFQACRRQLRRAPRIRGRSEALRDVREILTGNVESENRRPTIGRKEIPMMKITVQKLVGKA